MNSSKILLADYNVAGLPVVSPYSSCWSSRAIKCWMLQFWAICAECCSCTVGVWKWHDSLKCVMKCFWVGRRHKAAALSSAGNLLLAVALPAPSAINICMISKGLIYLQYKMYWWCEFSLCWDPLHPLLTSGMILLSLLWCLCHLIFIDKKSNCWLQTSA